MVGITDEQKGLYEVTLEGNLIDIASVGILEERLFYLVLKDQGILKVYGRNGLEDFIGKVRDKEEKILFEQTLKKFNRGLIQKLSSGDNIQIIEVPKNYMFHFQNNTPSLFISLRYHRIRIDKKGDQQTRGETELEKADTFS